ncbi:MAG: metallophosphoesterase [Lachnospiraceae bacterium]|nr:metallophosphoesterase [Lachnospiraceae bacterium]
MELIQFISFFVLCFIISIACISIYEIRKLRIITYNIKHRKLPKEFNGYKLILLSDLHNCFYNVDKIIDTIKDEKPNGVIISGDLLVYGNNYRDNNLRSLDMVKEISKYSDVYFAPGNQEMGYMVKKNQEWLDYEKYLLDAENDNIYYLDNKSLEITLGNSNINIYGLHLTDGYYKRFIKKELTKSVMDKLLGECNNDIFNILIAHNPDYFDDYKVWGADLVLSGHNHGGLLKLPLIGGVISPRLRLFPKYDYGQFRIEDSILILSGGLGAHSLKIRVNNKPELVIINFIK